MKTQKIHINKTSEQPEGVEIEIVQPQTPLQANLLCFLLPSILRELKASGRLGWELPDPFAVTHKSDGTFVVSATASDTDYYTPPRPVAILGIRTLGNRFDLVHAELKAENLQVPPQNATPDTTDAASPSAGQDKGETVTGSSDESGELGEGEPVTIADADDLAGEEHLQ